MLTTRMNACICPNDREKYSSVCCPRPDTRIRTTTQNIITLQLISSGGPCNISDHGYFFACAHIECMRLPCRQLLLVGDSIVAINKSHLEKFIATMVAQGEMNAISRNRPAAMLLGAQLLCIVCLFVDVEERGSIWLPTVWP